MPPC
jgi:hypothetical protein